MKKIILIALSLVVSSAFAMTEKSPFTDVTFDAAPSVTVTYEGEEYFLLSINGMSREDIMTQCQNAYGENCQANFALNFLETMKAVGMPITDDSVSLRLYKFSGHRVVLIDEAMLSSDNVEEIIFNRELRGED